MYIPQKIDRRKTGIIFGEGDRSSPQAPVNETLFKLPPRSKTQVVCKNLLVRKKCNMLVKLFKFIIMIFRPTHLDPFPDFDKDRIASLLSVILRKDPNVFRSIWQVNFGYTRTKNKNRFFQQVMNWSIYKEISKNMDSP